MTLIRCTLFNRDVILREIAGCGKCRKARKVVAVGMKQYAPELYASSRAQDSQDQDDGHTGIRTIDGPGSGHHHIRESAPENGMMED